MSIYATNLKKWTQPTPGQVADLVYKIKRTQAEIADCVGVKDASTIRKWMRGEAKISFAHWRLMSELKRAVIFE